MSLIQDALKRQQEESEGNRVPLKVAPVRPPAAPEAQVQQAGNVDAAAPTFREVGASRPAPSVPDTMPAPPPPPATLGVVLRAGPEPADRPLPASQPSPADRSLPANRPLPQAAPDNQMQPKQSGKSWKQIAGIIFLCILIAWGGGLLVTLVLKQSPERTGLGKFIPDLTRLRVTLGKPSVKAPLSPPNPPAATMPQPVVTPAPARSSAPTPLPWISPAAAAAPAFGDEQENEEEVDLPSIIKPELPVVAPSPILVAAPKPHVPVVWPRLKLSAVFSNVGSGQAGARLNNRLILLGDRIEGVTLIEIRQDSVVLKCGTEVRLLKMGMTLY